MYQKQEMTFREPESPVITTSLSLGISKLIFFKLCSFAPLITILSFILTPKHVCTFIINTCNNYYTIFICFKQVFVESFLIYMCTFLNITIICSLINSLHYSNLLCFYSFVVFCYATHIAFFMYLIYNFMISLLYYNN